MATSLQPNLVKQPAGLMQIPDSWFRAFVSFRAALGVKIISKVIPIAKNKSSKVSCLKKEGSKPVISGGLSCILSCIIEVVTRKAV